MICSRHVSWEKFSPRGVTCNWCIIKSVQHFYLQRDCNWLTFRVPHVARSDEVVQQFKAAVRQDSPVAVMVPAVGAAGRIHHSFSVDRAVCIINVVVNTLTQPLSTTRGYAYAKIECVSVSTYLSNNRIRVWYVSYANLNSPRNVTSGST